MSIQMNLDNGSEKIKGYVKSQSDSNRAFRAPGAYKEVKQAIETLDLDDLQDAGTNSGNTDVSDIDLDSSESLDNLIKIYDESIKEMKDRYNYLKELYDRAVNNATSVNERSTTPLYDALSGRSTEDVMIENLEQYVESLTGMPYDECVAEIEELGNNLPVMESYRYILVQEIKQRPYLDIMESDVFLDYCSKNPDLLEKYGDKSIEEENYTRDLEFFSNDCSKDLIVSHESNGVSYIRPDFYDEYLRDDEYYKKIHNMDGSINEIAKAQEDAIIEEKVKAYIEKVDKLYKEAYGITWTEARNKELVFTMLQKEDVKYLEEDEKKLYIYLIKDGDADAGNAYLEAMQDKINQKKGQEEAEKLISQITDENGNIDADGWDYLAATWEGFLDGGQNFLEGIANIFANDGLMSANQYAQMFILDGINSMSQGDILSKLEGETLKATYEISTSLGNMAPSILISAAAAYLTGGAGITIGTKAITFGELAGGIAVGLSAGGNAKMQALIQGSNLASANLYGLCSGLSEAGLGYLLGNIPGLNSHSALSLKGLFSEGFEEMMQECVSAGLGAALLGEVVDLSQLGADALKSFFYGAITSGIMNGGKLALKITINGMKYTFNNLNSLIEYITSNIYQSKTSEKLQVRNYSDKNGYQITNRDFGDGWYNAQVKNGFFSTEQVNDMINNVNTTGYISKETGDYIDSLFDGSTIYIKTINSTDLNSIFKNGVMCLGTTTSIGGNAPQSISEINLENTVTKVDSNSIYVLVSLLKSANGFSQGMNPIDGTIILKVPKGLSEDNIFYYNQDFGCYCIDPKFVNAFLGCNNSSIVSDPIFNYVKE